MIGSQPGSRVVTSAQGPHSVDPPNGYVRDLTTGLARDVVEAASHVRRTDRSAVVHHREPAEEILPQQLVILQIGSSAAIPPGVLP